MSIKREAGRWYVCFSVEIEALADRVLSEDIGIDLGLSSFAVLSDGTVIDNPRWFKRAQPKLRIAQRRVARRQRGSKGRRKAVELLQRAHAKVRNQHRDFHHQTAKRLLDTYSVVYVEDLNIKGLASGMRAKSVNDAE